MAREITPLEHIIQCIENKENFVLQGGAGSGKTETLKQVLEYIAKHHPKKRIACITHTNLAVDEIKSRIDGDYTISTIHSFLHNLIKTYKKNIHQVIHKIYQLPKAEDLNIDDFESESAFKRKRYDEYKKIYERHGRINYRLTGQITDNVIGKRLYDKDFVNKNQEVNDNIETLNDIIKTKVEGLEHHLIHYSESTFSDIEKLSYSHDDLLNIVSFLCEEYPKLNRIIQDKYDFIFIDEYQDTNPKIIDIFLNKFPSTGKTTIGLFGDAMQSIYDDGVQTVDNYVAEGLLKTIPKKDNFRCSPQVIDFITNFRNDGLEQEVAFKNKNGNIECIDDRQGSVKLYYAISDEGVNRRSSQQEKAKYFENINKVIEEALKDNPNFKILMLTNKAISTKVGFPTLYSIFQKKSVGEPPRKEIEEHLERLQLLKLCELCDAYQNKKFNFVLSKLKQAGRHIITLSDKIKIKEIFDEFIQSDESAFKCLKKALALKLIPTTSRFERHMENVQEFLNSLEEDTFYQKCKSVYYSDGHTYTKMVKQIPTITKSSFASMKRKIEKERFHMEFQGDDLSFQEILNFYQYYIDNTPYITMHKTKGTGIENVLVVLDNYFWNEYKFDFDSIFSDDNSSQHLKTLKLIYVACSRTKKNLICVKLIKSGDEERFQSLFSLYEKVSI